MPRRMRAGVQERLNESGEEKSGGVLEQIAGFSAIKTTDARHPAPLSARLVLALASILMLNVLHDGHKSHV